MKTENTIREQYPLPQDLNVLLTVAAKGSFAEAARHLGQSPAYISKRIATLEKTLQTQLLHRTTRQLTFTEEGVSALDWATRVIDNLDDMVTELSKTKENPRGQLHICSSFGFGRAHVAPALAELSAGYPELDIHFDVFDRNVDLIAEGFDVEIYIGDQLPPQYICKQLASHERILCATPDYLRRYGTPQTIDELANHQCLTIKDRHLINGSWQLDHCEGGKKSVKINGTLTSNNGDIVRQWALNHRGIMLRAYWDVKQLIEQGTLVQILPHYTQPANIWAVYPKRLSTSAKTRVCVEFLAKRFQSLSK
ncbi:LysR substrate-binding domain-containing protein [Photobacterium sp. ZSDE20]|uniref:LysR substrate-binding domain-containing protein n=1 Tax=Photobacterium pectinilyticum TaxID=2906793 RepID=A0ABT1NCC5_9GAMM|nr:LysR substrate-binding domain-containing protein [Photobacterium sp. ZSDE20]MCQ1061316.1 LysR substrate-binding domain-containing protein [Photobacterium sp. ZSDE20]MDD1826912.1 LysR substrate-binding domain-containing protein [Photobacterium sp. ZSDE20]